MEPGAMAMRRALWRSSRVLGLVARNPRVQHPVQLKECIDSEGIARTHYRIWQEIQAQLHESCVSARMTELRRSRASA